MRTSTPEERKVLDVLSAHRRKVPSETHRERIWPEQIEDTRILARFEERGIITAAKSGNTNDISSSRVVAVQ